MLLTMATGTGKTLVMVNQIYQLMKAGVARRVLFLVDRRALAAQAVRAFASFEAEPGLKFDKIYELYSQRFARDDFDADEPYDPKQLPESYLVDPRLGHAYVYISTIQRMTMNLFGKDAVFQGEEQEIDEDAGQLDIPIHAFDLIVADECHRGYSIQDQSIWRATLDHFDAMKIGLTATPAAHTTRYFGDVVHRYTYEEAVEDGWLVDYDAVRINSKVRINGVFLKQGDQVEQIDPKSGLQQLDLLEDERDFDASRVERDITAPDSNLKILRELREYATNHEAEYGRFPKTLIFAVNDLPHTSHADQLVRQAREVFGRGEAFVAKITGHSDRPLQRIREFRNRPNPAIAVTVDMLTTGVDIPDLEYIVFLRPVKSRILFEQMLGRGTRKGEKLLDKSHFVVFDCFNGTLLEYFKNTTGMTADVPEGDGKTVKQIIDEIWSNRDRAYNTRRLARRLQRIDKEMTGDACELFARWIPSGDLGLFAGSLGQLIANQFDDTMGILRDGDFQTLLLKYPRPSRTFLVAHEVQDAVSSEWLIRGGIGKQYRPEDYLAAFEKFIHDNEDSVEAIAILLDRPRSWNGQALRALRDNLKSAPEQFTEVNLQKAYGITYHKALADIISMVKRAAKESALLLTAEERVDDALARVVADRNFTAEQETWLGFIRQHLIANLSIDQQDFDLVPVLSQRGGWGRANRVFAGDLSALIDRLNEELVAA